MKYSINDIEKKIPTQALEFFKNTFPANRVREIYEAIRTPRVSSFRLNPLKGERRELIQLLKKENIKFQEVGGIDGAFILQQEENIFQKSELYKNGWVYLQGLSGILSPLWLNPKPQEKVLDMAAAPGSKTTLLAGLMKNQGTLHAVEPDYIRMERLKFNCKTLSVTNVEFFQTNAEKFCREEKEIYDAILADVPCSGEGRFNLNDTSSYLSWKENEIPKFARLQLKILRRAVELLKPGGRLVYSTCTMNQQENEEVIKTLLKENSETLKLETPQWGVSYPEFEKVKVGNSWALRIFPSVRFEGFFIALLRK